MTKIEVTSAIERHPVHPSITPGQISQLVEVFYGHITAHERLGPIFNEHIGAWPPHLERMKGFWRSVLLRTGEYKGKPVPVHLKIENIETGHFREWLELFSKTASGIFDPEAAHLVVEAAQRIATSLWLSRSTDIFETPPVWSERPADTEFAKPTSCNH
jgi:hemoglobin